MKPDNPQLEHEEIELLDNCTIASVNVGRISFQGIRDHLTGPVISIAIHVVLFSLLAALFIGPEKETDEVLAYKPEVILLPDETISVKNQIPERQQVPENNVAEENKVSEKDYSFSEPDIKFVQNDQSPGSGGNDFNGNFDFKKVDLVGIGNLPLGNLTKGVPIPGPYSLREPQKIIDTLTNQNATETDHRLLMALKWLKEKQNVDGSWGEELDKQPALTGLATLAFLGRGIEAKDKNFGETLIKALKKLVEFGNSTHPNGVIKGDANAYCHPIVAYALSEAYCLMKIPPLEDVMNRMTSVMVKGQNKYGSFNYRYNNIADQKTGEPRSDLSYAGWNFQALKAAFNAGSDVPDLENALIRSVEAVQKTHSGSDGSFCYGASKSSGIGSISMTSVGILSLQLLNAGKSIEAVKGLKWIETFSGGKFMNCGWRENSGSPWALYTWYYQTQAIFQGEGGKGDVWKKWNERFLKGSLMKEQERDGHWSSPQEKYASSKNGQGHGEGTGSVFKNSSLDLNIYSTSMCCLMLEVYYKYLPTFKIASSEDKRGLNPLTSEERVVIE